MSQIRYDSCRSCSASIMFVVNKSTGKPNPLNREADENGNIYINFDKGEYTILTKNDVPKAKQLGWILYSSHFANCPDSEKFRRGK